ncbi:MAG TPA: hypothetical protein VF167_14650 [Longimicrobiaceae bacterium]
MSKGNREGAAPREAPSVTPTEPAGRRTEQAGSVAREQRWDPQQPRDYPDPIDDALDDTFPASDPPAWMGR